jgi:hypothetical protein
MRIYGGFKPSIFFFRMVCDGFFIIDIIVLEFSVFYLCLIDYLAAGLGFLLSFVFEPLWLFPRLFGVELLLLLFICL